MQPSTPQDGLKKRRVIAAALSSAFLSLAAEAGVAPLPGAIFRPRLEAGALATAAVPEAPKVIDVDRVINEAALEHGVSRHLIRAIIETESEFDRLAVSSSGACGLMQLMPGTVRRFGVADCFDVRENVAAGTRFLKALLIRYKGSIPLSVAAYNAGETAVARHRGIPPYGQTRAYVRRVQAILGAVPEGRAAKAPARGTDS
jgi:soluble lytic murein transglycosylase-like protein